MTNIRDNEYSDIATGPGQVPLACRPTSFLFIKMLKKEAAMNPIDLRSLTEEEFTSSRRMTRPARDLSI